MDRLLIATLVVLFAVLAGCSDGEDDRAGPAGPEGPVFETPPGSERDGGPRSDGQAQATPEPEGGDGIDALSGADDAAESGENTGTGRALLQRVELGRHEGFDRVVFEFAGHVPGWRAEYVSPPITQDGSGDEVDVAGNAHLRVRFEPASSYDLDAGEATFSPRRLVGADAGTSVVREAVRTGDFEAVMTWVIGVSDRVDFRTRVLSGPPRLVVDLRNH